MDSTGLVTGGSTGTLTVSALVSRKSGGAPAAGFARVTVLPQPAAKLSFDREVSRLYEGQTLTLEATPYAANNDRRYDEVLWKSDNPRVVVRVGYRASHRGTPWAGHHHGAGLDTRTGLRPSRSLRILSCRCRSSRRWSPLEPVKSFDSLPEPGTGRGGFCPTSCRSGSSAPATGKSIMPASS